MEVGDVQSAIGITLVARPGSHAPHVYYHTSCVTAYCVSEILSITDKKKTQSLFEMIFNASGLSRYGTTNSIIEAG